MEGLLYVQKYSISGPEFGITERRISNRKGKAALPCPCMNREVCCLQLSQLTSAKWNHTLVSGFTWERRLLHLMTALRPSTNKLLTDWDKNIINLNFSTARLTKTISTTVYLNLVKHRFNKRIGNLMSFNKRTFLHTGSLALPTLLHCLSWASPIMSRSTLRSWICDVLVSLVAGGFVACIVRAWQCGWVRG